MSKFAFDPEHDEEGDRAREIGRSNASEAIDQHKQYGTMKDSLDNYWDNMHDTLSEYKLGHKYRHAHEGFVGVLKAHRIKHRP